MLSAVQPVLREMVQVSGTAEKLLRDEKAGRIELEPDEREAAMQGARWGMAQPEVRTVELYAASGAYGLDMPERLFLQVFMWRADISHEKGWETGRPSEPAFMDLNLHATRDVSSLPRAAVWQDDVDEPMWPKIVIGLSTIGVLLILIACAVVKMKDSRSAGSGHPLDTI